MARSDPLLLTAAVGALLGLLLLTAALASDDWSILEVEDAAALSGSKLLSSHSGLWNTCEGQKRCVPLTDPVVMEGPHVSPKVQDLITLHETIMVVLLVSLVIILWGWILLLFSYCTRNISVLVLTAFYLCLGGGLTLAGTIIYFNYSHLTLAERYGVEHMQGVSLSFGLSLALALISCISEMLSGALVFMAVGSLRLDQCQDMAHSV